MSTDLDTASANLATMPEGQVLLDILTGKIDPPPIDPAILNDRITKAMLEAETPEEALKAGATVSFEDGLLGVPVEVRDVVYRKSALAGDVPTYALIDGYRLDEGEDVIITCSAAQVQRTLGVWKVRGWLPATFVVKKADNPTGQGFTPYTITTV